MTEKEYRADPRLSQSTIKIFSGSDEEYSREQALYKLKNPKPSTEAMNKGSLFHSIMEHEGNYDRKRFAVGPCDDKRKAEWREFKKETDAEYLMKPSELKECRDMYEKFCLSYPHLYQILKEGEKEVPYFTDEFKCLVDLDHDRIYDWKKVADITIKGLRKSCANFGYDIQAYHYNMITGKEFTFVFFQDVAPYEIVVYNCEPEFIERGKGRWNQSYERYLDRNIIEPREVSMLWDSEKI